MVIGDAQLGVNAGLGAKHALALSLANGRDGPLHFFGEISATAPRPQGYAGSGLSTRFLGGIGVWACLGLVPRHGLERWACLGLVPRHGREGPLTFFLGVIGESAAASHGCKGSTVQIGGMATEGAAKDTKAARSQRANKNARSY